ncbi:MAG TPA: hypothetical protein VHF89_09015 [Solirubrobacteraceae bacterium]|nr:hypothetical protein [Solirubrobacteraceae bacterium]
MSTTTRGAAAAAACALVVAGCGGGKEAIRVWVEPERPEVGQVPFFRFEASERTEVVAVVDWCSRPAGDCERWERVRTEEVLVGPAQPGPIDLSEDFVQSTWPIFEATRPGTYRVTFSVGGEAFQTLDVPVRR